MQIPIITLDGPAGAGKGTVSLYLAQKLQWHVLESGALYRLLGYKVLKDNIDIENIEQLSIIAQNLNIAFIPQNLSHIDKILDNQNVTEALQTEECGAMASKLAAISSIREALLAKQHEQKKLPGLIADGRDMGTVVFPEAILKIFLTASLECRAERRFKQLKNKGHHVNLREILEKMAVRDKRDQERTVAPLKPADDAIEIDTSTLEISTVLEKIWLLIQQHKII